MPKLTTTKVTYDGEKWKVKVDGHNIANVLNGLTLTSNPSLEPELTLRFGWPDGVDFDGPAIVEVDDTTAAALKAMGWVSPNGAAELRAMVGAAVDRATPVTVHVDGQEFDGTISTDLLGGRRR